MKEGQEEGRTVELGDKRKEGPAERGIRKVEEKDG